MGTFSKFFLDIFYPNRCPCCDEFIRWDRLICQRCSRSLEGVYEKTCKNCGREKCICSQGLSYSGAVVPFRYEGLVREGILSLKRGTNTNFGEYSGKVIAKIIDTAYSKRVFDFVVPVPMSKKSRISRGYNQAEIIAEQIADRLDIPVRNDILYKLNTASSQHFLGRAQRFKNITAFDIHNIDLKGKNVILCDDVVTTSSTVNRCASLLRKAGADEVFLAAAAQSKPR